MVFWLFIAGCSSSKTVFETPQKVSGVIMLTGSEPFTVLTIRTGEGKVFLIDCGAEIKHKLLTNQGRIAELYYDRIENKTSGREIRVVRAVIRSN